MGRKKKAGGGPANDDGDGGAGSSGTSYAEKTGKEQYQAGREAYRSTFTGALPAAAMYGASLLQDMVQQRASGYSRSKIDPDIQELCDHFHIQYEHVRRLNEMMENRQDTFTADILRLWEVLENARSPEGMLVIKMREMDQGIFMGKITPDKELQEVIDKYGLDKEASDKLADVLEKRQKTRSDDIKQLHKHLCLSARPSAMAMMLLKPLRENQDVLHDPNQRPQSGSYADRHRDESSNSWGGGGGSWGGGWGGGRDRDRDEYYNRDRDRYNDRDRYQDRGGDRYHRDREGYNDRGRSRSRERW
mmetsp:Transcript_57640/g.105885  ORF Transcript_57640/g.105885 Transcript_57640/m.105885 type:complete len:304 (+) Transcript_57640:109-1020(+)